MSEADQNARRVLLVEDNWTISESTAAQLEGAGFRVVPALDAAEATLKLAEQAAAFDAVLIDVNLGPGPSGYELARGLRKLWPAMPIVFTTADAAGPVFAEHIGRAAHVGKPYTLDQLMSALSLAVG